jgi:hypothetical protein
MKPIKALNMNDLSDLKETIAVWKEKFSAKDITEDDLNRLNAVSPDQRAAILNAIPEAEDVFKEMSIDEDINGNLFFVQPE